MSPGSWRPELMDDPAVDPEVLADSLDHLAFLTIASGARRAIWKHARALLPRRGPVRIVDVGAGGGDVLRYLRRRLEGRLTLGLGVEPHAATAACASLRCRGLGELRFTRADAAALPLPADSMNLAMINMALHHIEPGARVRALAELARVGGGRVLVTDLTRSILNRLGARLLSATIWRGNPVVRADAPVSVERGFRRSELVELARSAGLRDVRVRGLYGHRLILTAGGGADGP